MVAAQSALGDGAWYKLPAFACREQLQFRQFVGAYFLLLEEKIAIFMVMGNIFECQF
jgi:hypothetical protein